MRAGGARHLDWPSLKTPSVLATCATQEIICTAPLTILKDPG